MAQHQPWADESLRFRYESQATWLPQQIFTSGIAQPVGELSNEGVHQKSEWEKEHVQR